MRRFLTTMMLAAAALLGCKETAPDVERPAFASEDVIPDSVAVPAGNPEVGTRMSPREGTVAMTAFRITKYPVRVGDWKHCMAARVCSAPALAGGACLASAEPREDVQDGATFGLGHDDLPMTCVSYEQAMGYCAWLRPGARVPGVDELLYAARGPKVTRFAWGDERGGCSQTWRRTFAPDLPDACCGVACGDPAGRLSGRHPAGDGPFGLSDMLLSHAELVGFSTRGGKALCPGDTGCVVTGLEPGAMDWVYPLSSRGGEDEQIAYAAAFRCVWETEVER
jgi:formylglycine-generating enzyme required for sulfatase activity